LAALAAVLMAFSRRPSVRYLVATGALAAMLAAPVATFFVLMEPVASVHALLASRPVPRLVAVTTAANPSSVTPMSFDAMPRVMNIGAENDGAAVPLQASSKPYLSSRFVLSDYLPPNILSSNILAGLVEAWLCGVALFSLRFAGGFLLLEHKRRRLSRAPSQRILALCHELQCRLGLNRAIRYLECGWLQAPAVIGWIRPIVLLPVLAATGLSEAQLRMVIAHELAHIRRHDSIVNLLQILVETLLFYHPAIWWLNKRIRTERELCCDEIAVSLTGDWLEYVRALMLMEEWEQAPVLAMAANRGPLSHRIFHLLGKKPFGAGQRILGLTGSILFLAAALGAANALFGIAYPIPMAHADASLKTALSSSRIAVDHMARQVNQTGEPLATGSDQGSGNDATDQKTSAPDQAPDQTQATAQAEKPVVTSPALPRQSLVEISVTPARIASNDPPAAPIEPASTQPGSNISPAAAEAALNDQAGPSNAAQAAASASTCALPKLADTVQLNQLPESDLMTVPVEINGKTKQFLLDIGTNPTEVSQATVAELGLPQDARMNSTIMSAGNGFSGNVGGSALPQLQTPVYDLKGNQTAYSMRTRVRIGTFTIGEATARNMQLMVANDGEIGRSAPYDGLLTDNFFKQYDVEVDFRGKAVNYLTPTQCTDPDQVVFWSHSIVAVIPMTLVDGKIRVPVMIEGHPVQATIDTSSPRSIMRRDIAELTLGYKADTPAMAPAGDLKDGMGQTVYAHSFSRISFAGGVTAVNVPALIETNGMLRDADRDPVLGSKARSADARIPDFTMGMDVLHQLHMYIVFGQSKLYVTAAQ
jgi:beta-lactamase regulating signal transducer with metallopeptidase domain